MFHSADSNEHIGQVTKKNTTANFEYLGPQFTEHLNVNFRFCKETPLHPKLPKFLLLALFVHCYQLNEISVPWNTVKTFMRVW